MGETILSGKSHTRKCQLGEHKQVQTIDIVLVRFCENQIGSVEIIVDIAHLRRKLKTCNAHCVGVLLAGGRRLNLGDRDLVNLWRFVDLDRRLPEPR